MGGDNYFSFEAKKFISACLTVIAFSILSQYAIAASSFLQFSRIVKSSEDKNPATKAEVKINFEILVANATSIYEPF